MHGGHASSRRRYHLSSLGYFYSKMLRDKMFLISVVRTHYRTRSVPEVTTCLEGESRWGPVRLLTATSQQRSQKRRRLASRQLVVHPKSAENSISAKTG